METLKLRPPSETDRQAFAYKLRRAQRAGKIIRIFEPAILGIGFLFKATWWICFGWWLEPIGQERSNAALRRDIANNLSFVFPEGRFIVEPRTKILPFDYATATVLYRNVSLGFTRGRGELNVTVAPRHLSSESRELSLVLTALTLKRRSISTLAEASSLLRDNLPALNAAFSEQEYPEFAKRYL